MSGDISGNNAPNAERQLSKIKDRRIKMKLLERMTLLADSPHLQGKSLTDELAGWRSVRAVGQRFRIVFKINESSVTVYVLGAGIRREGDSDDVYSVLKRIVKLGKV